eukprot:scaffold69056_cov37-Tisochrysis_lutea.AAC.1
MCSYWEHLEALAHIASLLASTGCTPHGVGRDEKLSRGAERAGGAGSARSGLCGDGRCPARLARPSPLARPGPPTHAARMRCNAMVHWLCTPRCHETSWAAVV